MTESGAPEPTAADTAAAQEALKGQAEKVFKGRAVRVRWSSVKLEQLKCWPRVLAMLENGDRVPDIARFIQEEAKEYLEATRKSVENGLYYWLRRSREMVGEITPTTHMRLLDSNPIRVDPVDALNMLLAIQVDRMTEHYVQEKRDKRFTRVGNEGLRVAAEIARTIAEVERMGRKYAPPPVATGKGPADVAAQFEQMRRAYSTRYGDVAARAILGDESRRKIMSALERVRKLGDSDKLVRILMTNEARAEELSRKETERQEAEILDAEVVDSGGGGGRG